MYFLVYLSNLVIPLLIFYVVATGLAAKKDVYKNFLDGSKEGINTVVKIMPTLIGLMVAVGILRASGFLDFLAQILTPMLMFAQIPGEAVPVLLVKMFSSSAATGLVLDLFENFGPDSYVGNLVSLAMSSSETIFYTMSVYFMVAKIRKTRYTLLGALLSTLVGILASILLAKSL